MSAPGKSDGFPCPPTCRCATASNAAPEVETHLLKDNDPIPNNPRLPLLVYRAVLKLPPDDPAAGV